MADFSLSNSQTIDANPEARAALDKALSSFASYSPIQGTVAGSSNSLPTAEVIDSEELTPSLQSPQDTEPSGDVQQPGDTEEEAEDTGEDSEDDVDLSGFDKEFSKRFGIAPEEAVETINSLLAFRDEMTLMRGWGVSPAEYDSRMSQVQEFYKTLPEEKQPEFNSMEGAKAIWEHLEKSNPSTRRRNSTTTKVGSSKKTAATQKPPQNFIKKSEILKMDKETYNSRLPEITRAFREGRVLEYE